MKEKEREREREARERERGEREREKERETERERERERARERERERARARKRERERERARERRFIRGVWTCVRAHTPARQCTYSIEKNTHNKINLKKWIRLDTCPKFASAVIVSCIASLLLCRSLAGLANWLLVKFDGIETCKHVFEVVSNIS